MTDANDNCYPILLHTPCILIRGHVLRFYVITDDFANPVYMPNRGVNQQAVVKKARYSILCCSILFIKLVLRDIIIILY